MYKYVYKEVMVPENKSVLTEVICNKCGRSWSIPEDCEWSNEIVGQEMHHLGSRGGYFSKIGDETSWTMDICDECMIEIMASCKIAPEFRDHMAYDETEEEVQKWHEEWLAKKREELSTVKTN